MNHKNTIRRFSAAFFLLLFSFCITPKRWLHDLLANHKDAQSAANTPVQQITTSGYHCHVDDLVVVEPYLPDIQSLEPVILSSLPHLFPEPVKTSYAPPVLRNDGRGPPAAVCS